MNFLLKAEVQKLQALANEQVDLYCFRALTSEFQFAYFYFHWYCEPQFDCVSKKYDGFLSLAA